MWEEVQTYVLDTVGAYSWRIVQALLIFTIGIWVTRVVRRSVKRVLITRKLDATVVYFGDSCIKIVLYGVVLIAALHKLGIETTSLVAMLGAAGLAIGLAFNAQLANVAAGLIMIVFRPFSVGDYIEGGGAEGAVEKIELMSTEIRTPDNVTVIIPNSRLTADKVINYSHRDTRRLEIVIRVNYKADLKKMRDALHAVIEKEDLILKEPQPSIAIKELGDKGIKIAIAGWVKSNDYLKAKMQLNEKVKELYDSEEVPLV
ncbi:MAG: mechanosensitive ion channel family protein [Desulfomonilaceae bacterium]